MKIALVNLPMVWLMNPGEIGRSLAIEYLAAVAKRDGCRVDCVDALRDRLTLAETARRLVSGDYDLVGISMTDYSLPLALELCRELRDARFHLCLGGYGATFWADDLLRAEPRIDSIVIGEGELTFAELLRAIGAGGDWRSTIGIAYRDGDSIVRTPPRPLIENLDDLPVPAREEPSEAEVIAASRGCYANCSFCDIVNFYRLSPGSRVRVRTPASVAAEMASLPERPYEFVMFVDDDFLGIERVHRGWVRECVGELASRKVSVPFFIQSRVNDIDRGILEALKSVGLRYVGLGIESHVPRMLKDFKKGTTPAQNLAAVATLKELRLYYNIYFILYDAFTTLDELDENLRFLETIDYASNPAHFRKPVTAFQTLRVLPGTSMFGTYRDLGLLEKGHFEYRWRFQDPAVDDLYRTVSRWRETVVNRFLLCKPLEAGRYLRNAGLFGRARRIYLLAREFLAFDVAFIRAAVACHRERPADHRAHETFLDTWTERGLALVESLLEAERSAAGGQGGETDHERAAAN